MATNKKLKAYARYDGTGRIIPSSVVLRTKKPSGNFRELVNYAYECCNPTTTTTTTSTTTTTTL